MTIINWLLLLEVLACIGLLIWLFRRAHHHVKKSPALQALEQYLKDLESEKAQRVAQKQIAKETGKKKSE